jgi:hypothetical protein
MLADIKKILNEYFIAVHRYGRLNGEEYYIHNYEPYRMEEHNKDREESFRRLINLEEKISNSIEEEVRIGFSGGRYYQKGKGDTLEEFIYDWRMNDE